MASSRFQLWQYINNLNVTNGLDNANHAPDNAGEGGG